MWLVSKRNTIGSLSGLLVTQFLAKSNNLVEIRITFDAKSFLDQGKVLEDGRV
jgi:hypothetical protein